MLVNVQTAKPSLYYPGLTTPFPSLSYYRKSPQHTQLVLNKLLVSEFVLLPAPSLLREHIPWLRGQVDVPEAHTEDPRTAQSGRGGDRRVPRREPHRTAADGDI